MAGWLLLAYLFYTSREEVIYNPTEEVKEVAVLVGWLLLAYLVHTSREEVMYNPTEEVKEGGCDGRMRADTVMHNQNSWLYVHDVILNWIAIEVRRMIS